MFYLRPVHWTRIRVSGMQNVRLSNISFLQSYEYSNPYIILIVDTNIHLMKHV